MDPTERGQLVDHPWPESGGTAPVDPVSDETSVVAATWLCRRDDAVLAVLPRGSDFYYLPGGMPESGEALAEATAREVAEELGIQLDADTISEVVRVKGDAHGRPGVTVILVCFAGTGRGAPVPDGDEIVEVAWLKRHDWHRFASAVRLALSRLDAGTICRAT